MLNQHKRKVTSKSGSDDNPGASADPTADWRKRRDQAIRQYHQLGLYPIPLSGKKPYQKQWQKLEKYQGLDTEAVLRLFSAEDNVGLLCGIPMVEGRFLRGIDYDDDALWETHLQKSNDDEGYEWLKGGPVVETGSGKRHHYVLSDTPAKFVFAGAGGIADHGGEIQGEGTQLVVPPSIHPVTRKEYRWLDESWQDIHFVDHLTLAASYPAKAGKQKFNGHSKKKEKQGFSSSDTGDFGNDITFYDYSTIDFIALFQSRGWVIEDKGETVVVLCPNRAQHTDNSDGTSSTVILRTPAGGQRFKCLHGHCEHFSDRDNLVDLLGGPSILEGFAKKRNSSAGSQESASTETKAPPTTPWLRLDSRSGLYHVRQIEAANAFRRTDIQLDDPELEQKLLGFLESPSGGEDISSTLNARTLADVLKLLRTQGSSGEKVRLRQASDIPMESIQWLWKDWLGQGKLHLLAGQPGTGKTTIAMQMAAIVSTGGNWPDGSQAKKGNVLIWSGEDDPKDTLVPRLALAGADLQRINFIGNVFDEQGTRGFDPAKDLRMLAAELKKIGSLSLLIADPIVSAVSGDSHRNTEVRRALQPLVDLAEAQNCAVLGITHFSKSNQVRDPLDRVTGSVGFAAVARIVLGTIKQTNVDSEDKRSLIRLKSNIGADRDGYAYTLEQKQVPGHEEISNSKIQWGEAVYGSAQQIFEDVEAQQSDSRRQPRDEALEFLRDLLSEGAKAVKPIQEEVKAAGLAWPTIRRAADELKVIKRKVGGPKEKSYWEWSLPEEPTGFSAL